MDNQRPLPQIYKALFLENLKKERGLFLTTAAAELASYKTLNHFVLQEVIPLERRFAAMEKDIAESDRDINSHTAPLKAENARLRAATKKMISEIHERIKKKKPITMGDLHELERKMNEEQ